MLPVKWGKRLRFRESHQRAICRLVFLACVLAPTVYCIAVSTVAITPLLSYTLSNSWSATLTRDFGCRVAIDNARPLAPDRLRLRSVVFRHPETSQLIGIFDAVEIVRSKTHWWIDVRGGAINNSELKFLVDTIHSRWLCQPQQNYPKIFLTASNIDVVSSNSTIQQTAIDRTQVIQGNLRIETRSDLTQQQSAVVCYIQSGGAASKDARTSNHAASGTAELKNMISVLREHRSDHPTTTWNIRNPTLPIASKLLENFIGDTDWSGNESTLSGTVEITHSDRASRISVEQLVVQHFDWNKATRLFPVLIDGKGSIHLQDAVIENGELVRGACRLHCEHGSIDHNGLVYTVKDLNTQILGDVLRGVVNTVPFESFGGELLLDEGELRIVGGIPDKDPTIMPSLMANARGGFLWAPQQSKIAWADLKRWLGRNRPSSLDSTSSAQANEVQPAAHFSVRPAESSDGQSLPITPWVDHFLAERIVAEQSIAR